MRGTEPKSYGNRYAGVLWEIAGVLREFAGVLRPLLFQAISRNSKIYTFSPFPGGKLSST